MIRLFSLLIILLVCTTGKAAGLEIQVNQQKISLPYWPTAKEHKGGIVIVHDYAVAQSPLFLVHISEHLAKSGWSLVLLSSGQAQWIEQLPAAISALRQDNNPRIVVIHYGSQLQTTIDYFVKPQSKQVNGLVLLSAFDITEKKETAENLSKIVFAQFDIVGQFDFDTVLVQANIRKQHDSDHYVYLKLPGAGHDYAYAHASLIAFLNGWMSKLPVSIAEKPPI